MAILLFVGRAGEVPAAPPLLRRGRPTSSVPERFLQLGTGSGAAQVPDPELPDCGLPRQKRLRKLLGTLGIRAGGRVVHHSRAHRSGSPPETCSLALRGGTVLRFR